MPYINSLLHESWFSVNLFSYSTNQQYQCYVGYKNYPQVNLRYGFNVQNSLGMSEHLNKRTWNMLIPWLNLSGQRCSFMKHLQTANIYTQAGHMFVDNCLNTWQNQWVIYCSILQTWAICQHLLHFLWNLRDIALFHS